MKFLVDTCGWLEWLTDGVLADEFAPYLSDHQLSTSHFHPEAIALSF